MVALPPQQAATAAAARYEQIKNRPAATDDGLLEAFTYYCLATSKSVLGVLPALSSKVVGSVVIHPCQVVTRLPRLVPRPCGLADRGWRCHAKLLARGFERASIRTVNAISATLCRVVSSTSTTSYPRLFQSVASCSLPDALSDGTTAGVSYVLRGTTRH